MNKLDWGNWLYSLIGATVSAGSTSVYSSFSAAVITPNTFAAGSSNFFKLMVYTFLFHGALAFFAFLSTRSLPSIKTTVTETESITSTQNPASVASVSVKETKTEPVQPAPATIVSSSPSQGAAPVSPATLAQPHPKRPRTH